jgi:hypothetical protein
MRLAAIVLIAAGLSTPAVSAGFELPPRKPGQWEMKIQVDTAAMPPQIIRMCLDEETDKLLNAKLGGTAAPMCQKQEQRKDGDALILDSECMLGEMKSVSHTVVTGDFNSAYTMKTSIEITGDRVGNATRVAPQGPTTQQTTLDATRVGECDAAMKPGDIDLGGGRTMNVRELPGSKLQ